MLRSIKNLCGQKLGARDGEIGRVADCYFDDQQWAIRYVVAHTAAWHPGRQVLIAPPAFGSLSQRGDRLLVNLTREQIQNSPAIESPKPDSQHVEELNDRSDSRPQYWDGDGMGRISGFPKPHTPDLKPIRQARHGRTLSCDDLHLRSVKALSGYQIQSDQGRIGHLVDLIMNDQNWEICEIIVDTDSWCAGKEIRITATQIERISSDELSIFVNVSMDTIREASEFASF